MYIIFMFLEFIVRDLELIFTDIRLDFLCCITINYSNLLLLFRFLHLRAIVIAILRKMKLFATGGAA